MENTKCEIEKSSELARLIERITRDIGPIPTVTPAAHEMEEARHRAAAVAGYSMTGAEAAWMARIAACALGVRYVHHQGNGDAITPKDQRERKRAALQSLFEALEDGGMKCRM